MYYFYEGGAGNLKGMGCGEVKACYWRRSLLEAAVRNADSQLVSSLNLFGHSGMLGPAVKTSLILILGRN